MADAPQRMDTAPKDGTRFLAWFQKVKLDEDDIATNEVIGGAWFVVSFSGGSWDYPADLEAAGSYFFDDWCWAEDPVLWRDLPPEPVAADYTPGVSTPQALSLSDERILHLWDTHVGYETSGWGEPLTNMDKIAFARAVLAAAGVLGNEGGQQR